MNIKTLNSKEFKGEGEDEGEGEIANSIQSKASKTRCDRRLLNYLINC